MLSRRLFLRRAAVAPLLASPAITALASLATPPVAAAVPVVVKVVPIAPGVYEGLIASANRQRIIQYYAKLMPRLMADMNRMFESYVYFGSFDPLNKELTP